MEETRTTIFNYFSLDLDKKLKIVQESVNSSTKTFIYNINMLYILMHLLERMK